jgi:hypothetical protein
MYITYYIDANNMVLKDGFEGVGAQYQRIIGLLAIAKRHNLKYFHIPIQIGHNYSNDPEWNQKWDIMFNIKKLANNNDIDYSLLEKIYTPYINDISLEQLLKDNENKTNILNHYFLPFNIFDSNPDYYLSNIQNDLITAYDDNNSTRKLIYDKTKINIAIHIRVYSDYDGLKYFDDYSNNKSNRFYMNCDMYITLISKLKNTYQNADIHIFSEETYFDLHYKKIRDIDNIKIHLNDLDTFDTFHHLCKADVLCLGTSSFSIVAGFYNKNTVIYLPYCHPPSLKSWIIYNPFIV